MPRLRMFAGPNGSGKSTMKEVIPEALLGVYINPDDIEKVWRKSGCIDLSAFKVRVDADDVLVFFRQSAFLADAGFSSAVSQLSFDQGRLCLEPVLVNSYFASVVSNFIRHKLLEQSIDFTFETVMSSSDKVDFLRRAKAAGFRVYLYYVATEDTDINISRVRHRVKMHGHDVPEDKIVERYFRSLGLLVDAIRRRCRTHLDGARDIVVTQGTDTIEETAFALDTLAAVSPGAGPCALTKRGAMNSADYQRVIAELDALSSQTSELIQRFEGTGFNVTMKDDYVSLHVLQHRILEMCSDYSRMVNKAAMPCAIPTKSH